MDINKVEMLLRAIELGSLSKASQEFSYTPSAFSHILSTLEKELNTTLIKRSYTGITPMEDKKEIIELMHKMLDIYKQIVHLARDNRFTKCISICSYSSVSKSLIPTLSKKLEKEYPDLKIDIIVSNNLKRFTEKADIIIGEKILLENYVWEELILDPYVAVVPVTNQSYGDGFSCERYYDDTLILSIDGKTQNYVKKEHFSKVITVRSDDDSSVLEMVKEGMGITILPLLSVDTTDRYIKVLPIHPPMTRKLGILYEKKYKNNPVIQSIAKEISKREKM